VEQSTGWRLRSDLGLSSFAGQCGVRQIHACVNLSAQTTQRPTVGGEESIDKNKQRMTIPPRIVATHIPGTNLHT
jgi:hypothetical protein